MNLRKAAEKNVNFCHFGLFPKKQNHITFQVELHQMQKFSIGKTNSGTEGVESPTI